MQLLLLVAALSNSALADGVLAVAPRYLYARQNQAFAPPTTVESGCQSNEIQCPGTFNGLPTCVTPTRGDVCCAEGYGCPRGSFCLIKGLCCPDGVDPKTCATRQSVTLPDGFMAGSTVAYSASTPATSSYQTPTPTSVKDAPTISLDATSVTSSSSSTVAVRTTTSTPPHTTPTNVSISASTTAGTTAGSTSIIPFTGDASAVSLGHSGIVAAIIGVVGLLW